MSIAEDNAGTTYSPTQTAVTTTAPAQADADGERNEVFTSLVKADGDIVGLVAYSIYKQNKHDWLVAFNRQKGREPDEVEAQSYIVGESTPRRLATYRHLAEATLEGRGPDVPAGSGAADFVRSTAVRRTGDTGAKIPGWVISVGLAIVFTIIGYLGARYGLPGLGPR